jgi:hypothetical protein
MNVERKIIVAQYTARCDGAVSTTVSYRYGKDYEMSDEPTSAIMENQYHSMGKDAEYDVAQLEAYIANLQEILAELKGKLNSSPEALPSNDGLEGQPGTAAKLEGDKNQ